MNRCEIKKFFICTRESENECDFFKYDPHLPELCYHCDFYTSQCGCKEAHETAKEERHD